MNQPRPWTEIAVALALLATVAWLRSPTFGASLWNVDEAIHAAAARTILDGGVLYRDAIDQRTPLSYFAVAGVFACFGENNLAAVRAGVAGVIAATAFLLFLAGRRLQGPAAGIAAAAAYALLSSSALSRGDAYAANTEWLVAGFSTAAAAVFLGGGTNPGSRRLLLTGAALGCSFLSKQPALLDLAAPAAAMAYAAWSQPESRRTVLLRWLALAAGWWLPVLLAAVYFLAHGALADAIFCTWTYNLRFYGPEITTAGRVGVLTQPFVLLGSAQPWLFLVWAAGALVTVHRLAQRNPAPADAPGNPGRIYLVAWSLAGLAGAASGGRDFGHYSIQFLAPFCLGAGVALARLFALAVSPARWPGRMLAGLLLAGVAWGLGLAVGPARQGGAPGNACLRAAEFVRAHTGPGDRIFVWGYQPEIYLFADRRPASRYLYASFVTGLIPWTNVAPERDTAYAAVPGAMEHLLQDLGGGLPAFIVDCSAGPNRHWQKYPLERYPPLQGFVQRNYRVVEAGQFVPQGFRLYQRKGAGEPVEPEEGVPQLAANVTATLKLGMLAGNLVPVRASAPHGASAAMVDGRMEYFAHAPSSIVYRLPAGGGTLRANFGIRAGAYAPENPGPTDGAEFIVRWREEGGGEKILLRRLLRPREEPADRGLQSLRIVLPPGRGELELAITPGPADNPASDWTFWTDLLLEKSP